MTRGTLFPRSQRCRNPSASRLSFCCGFLHIRVDVRKQGAELLPFLSPSLDGVVLRQKAGQVLAQRPLDRIAEGQPQDSRRGLGIRHTAKHWILRRGLKLRGLAREHAACPAVNSRPEANFGRKAPRKMTIRARPAERIAENQQNLFIVINQLVRFYQIPSREASQRLMESAQRLAPASGRVRRTCRTWVLSSAKQELTKQRQVFWILWRNGPMQIVEPFDDTSK